MLRRSLRRLARSEDDYNPSLDRGPAPSLSALPDVVVARYGTNGLRRSRLRSFIPFLVQGAVGSTAACVRAGFAAYPQLINLFFQELEKCDTEQVPRAQFAEAMHELLAGETRQADVRRRFEAAFDGFNKELNGRLGNEERVLTDPAYRLDILQLQYAAGYYSKYLEVTANPTHVAQHYISMAYQASIQKDSLIRDAISVLDDVVLRARLTPEYEELVANLCVIERDIYGPWRFDSRSGARMILHSIPLVAVGASKLTAEVVQVPVLRRYLNVTRTEIPKQGGRWMDVILTPSAEDFRAWKRGMGPLVASVTARSEGLEDAGNPGSPEEDEEGLEDLPLEPVMLPVKELNGDAAKFNYNCQLATRSIYPQDHAESAHFELPIVREPIGILQWWFKRAFF